LRARDTLYRIVSTEVQRPNDASNVLRSMPRSLFMAWTAECRVRSRNTLEDFAAMLHTSLLFTSPDEEPTPRVVRVAHGSPSE
jgi:hypothetical protein